MRIVLDDDNSDDNASDGGFYKDADDSDDDDDDYGKIIFYSTIPFARLCFLFFFSFQSDAAYIEVETRAIVVANNLGAEFWPTSSKSGILSHWFSPLKSHGGVFMNYTSKKAELIVPSTGNPELSKAPSLKPWIGQNIALHAFLAAKNSALPALHVYAFLVHWTWVTSVG